MRFDDYRIIPELKENLKALGFNRPTDIQYRAIGAVLQRQDVLAIAQTGTGKTAAFAIPIIHMLSGNRKPVSNGAIQCLVLVPTHELAEQISKVFVSLAQKTGLQTLYITGGKEQNTQIGALNKGVDILIATPGRLFDLRSQGHIQLEQLKILVLDEADHMLDLGFIGDIKDLMKYIPHRRQTLFFSATINDKIKKLAYSIVNNPMRIQVSPKDPVAKNIEHSLLMVEMDDKRFFLERLIKENPGLKMLVFVRTQVRAERVVKALERVQIPSISLHGGKDQKERDIALNAFRKGEALVLIATDLSARGIDIENVDLVLNYDLPDKAENYVHRVDRTGRGKKKGIALSYCAKEELEMLEEIETFMQKKIERADVSKSDYRNTVELAEGRDISLKDILSEIDNEGKTSKKRRK